MFPIIVVRRKVGGKGVCPRVGPQHPWWAHARHARRPQAWGKEHAALIEGVREEYPGATVIFGGDWDTRAEERPRPPLLPGFLAADLGEAHVAVLHIDGVLVLGGVPKDVRKLEDLHG